MRTLFFIYENNKLKEVDEQTYYLWERNNAENFLLQPFEKKVQDKTIRIIAQYNGRFEINQLIEPFILMVYESNTFQKTFKTREELVNAFNEAMKLYE